MTTHEAIKVPLSRPAPMTLADVPPHDAQQDVTDAWRDEVEDEFDGVVTAYFAHLPETFYPVNPYYQLRGHRAELVALSVSEFGDTKVYTARAAIVFLSEETVARQEERETYRANGW